MPAGPARFALAVANAKVWDALGMEVHLVDGTYELFRHYFGQPKRQGPDGLEIAATRGVVLGVLSMLERGVTHVGVATDHVVESFRNALWPGYKTSEGMPAALLAQFPVLEHGLVALGVTVWAMTELEADDALASAAAVAAADPHVACVRIWSPDKDLAQCVRDGRVVQMERRAGNVTALDEAGVRKKYGVGPPSIPDWLALVGDSADGFPGLSGWGRQSAALVLDHYTTIDAIPDEVGDWDPALRRRMRGAPRLAARLAGERARALLFRRLATLRVDPSLLPVVRDLAWRGPTGAFADVAAALGDPRLAARADAAATAIGVRLSGRYP